MRLGYRPALDGVRALAILPVVSLHAFGWPRAGSLGVDVFFVLSGFLITTLLLEEHAAFGRVRLRSFYRRRAARLAPALLVLVAVYAVVTGFHDLRSVAYAATYTTNIAVLVGNVPYALGHLWSLAQEEQFYLLWPPLLVFVLIRRPKLLPAVVSGLTLTIVIERLVIAGAGAGWQRLYYAPDAHSDPLLIGCAFALWYHARGPLRRQDVALAGAIGVVVGILTLDRIWPILFATPLRTFYATLCGLMILGAASGGVTSRLLAARPLTFVGRISYSLYLWHVPVLVATRDLFPSVAARAAIGVSLAVAAAVVSYYVVERPLRSWLTAPRRIDAENMRTHERVQQHQTVFIERAAAHEA